jgi:hypothetical protein
MYDILFVLALSGHIEPWQVLDTWMGGCPMSMACGGVSDTAGIECTARVAGVEDMAVLDMWQRWVHASCDRC